MKQVERVPLLQAKTVPQWRRVLVDSVLVVGSVSLVTGLIELAHLYPRVPTIAFIYLLVVLGIASIRGLFATIFAALLAFLTFDFFLLPPFYTFVVVKFEDLLTLCVFLAAAIITGQMAFTLRRRAEEARGREQEIRILYERAQELATLQERQRLARELHDSVSQALYGISLGAHTAREALESDPSQAMAPVEYVITLAEAGLAEMRALLFELRPESLETEGLVVALTKQVTVLRARYNLIVEADLGDEPDISIEIKEDLYRIAQEALHNIVKHARAKTVTLRLAREGNEIVMLVRDDGRGFDTRGSFPGHLGLRSMQERAEKIGGLLTIESASEKGTSIIIRKAV